MKDKEKKRIYDKQRYLRIKSENPDYFKRSQKRYYQMNKEKLCARARKWRKENPERTSAIEKRWRIRHHKQRVAIEKNWQDRNRAKLSRLAGIRQKKHPFEVQSRHKAWKNIIIPIHSKCSLCNSHKARLRHHKDYHKPFDVIFVCAKCHYKIHNEVN